MLAGLVAIVFSSPRHSSDPVALLAGETASRAQIELLRQKLGLDRPLPVQLVDYYRQLMAGDLGTSLFTTRPVWDDLSARLPATIELTIAAMIVAVAFGIPLGVLCASPQSDHRSRPAHLVRCWTGGRKFLACAAAAAFLCHGAALAAAAGSH
jgi:peptide/nickel transport system permease protein